ncbi:hypothetical protein RFI_03738, partial [Reticulomyxa filosa]
MIPEVVMPVDTKLADIKKWILEMDDKVTSNPAVLGLPPSAESLILSNRAQEFCANLLKLQDEENDNTMEELTLLLDNTSERLHHNGERKSKDKGKGEAGTLPGWMNDLRNNAVKWMEMLDESLPQGLEQLPEKSDSVQNPLFRFMRRELDIASRVLRSVKNELSQLIQFTDGNIKATNELRKV